jgi:hypothetical protein
VRGTLADIKQKCQAEKIASQAMIVASPTLGAADWPDLIRSKLYDPTFTHRFRKARSEKNQMMLTTTILLVGHGSRNRDGNKETPLRRPVARAPPRLAHRSLLHRARRRAA